MYIFCNKYIHKIVSITLGWFFFFLLLGISQQPQTLIFRCIQWLLYACILIYNICMYCIVYLYKILSKKGEWPIFLCVCIIHCIFGLKYHHQPPKKKLKTFHLINNKFNIQLCYNLIIKKFVQRMPFNILSQL